MIALRTITDDLDALLDILPNRISLALRNMAGTG